MEECTLQVPTSEMVTPLRVSLLVVLILLLNQMNLLSETDWKNNETIRNPIQGLAKIFMATGCATRGLRLMCGDKDGFPLRDLSYWDTIFGCFFYSMGVVFFLWMLTPLPDITSHLFLVVQFRVRTLGIEDAEHFVPELHWNPAGGEGPVLNA